MPNILFFLCYMKGRQQDLNSFIFIFFFLTIFKAPGSYSSKFELTTKYSCVKCIGLPDPLESSKKS